MVKTELLVQGAHGGSLVGELRSYMPCGVAKKKGAKYNSSFPFEGKFQHAPDHQTPK